MSKKVPNDKSDSDKPTMKQMKIFLTKQEHAVVTAAANMTNAKIGDYLKKAVIEQAKKDAKKMNDVIDSL